ncbi:endolytic transglycosylase MltG [Micrococcus porci]|uniref:endolytic transglycosylase MltG n=1 Tax=Micrococcus porci TaxID=2856555 RepID=UPI001CCCE14B|nr:endolytic transglycosylase MltG [Micrococcus porci]UBH23786.1 endolytic transglycosylase MltG [Micrococcus porci]
MSAPPPPPWREDETDDDLDVFGLVDHGEDEPEPEPERVERQPAPPRPVGRARRPRVRTGGSHRLRAIGRNLAVERPRGAVVLAVAALAVVLVAALLVVLFSRPADRQAVSGDRVTFTVEPGEDLASVAARLDERGIVASDRAVLDAAEDSGQTSIGAGEYVLREQMPAADALAVLQGRAEGASHYVVVGRGRWLSEVLDGLAQSTGLPRADFEAAAEDPTRYGVPEQAPSLEGWLDPGEYYPPVGADAEQVLAELVKPRLAHLRAQGVTDPAEQQRIVTIASILEAEALPKDYPRVAGVIDNRLNDPDAETRGLLQVDSTVNYGLGRRNLQFSAAQRADESNTYNTYQHTGLPPGPIGMPSDAAIEGAVHPEPSEDLYWVTTDIATGHTEFSRTYEEHSVHQEEFRRYCAQNPGVC